MRRDLRRTVLNLTLLLVSVSVIHIWKSTHDLTTTTSRENSADLPHVSAERKSQQRNGKVQRVGNTGDNISKQVEKLRDNYKLQKNGHAVVHSPKQRHVAQGRDLPTPSPQNISNASTTKSPSTDLHINQSIAWKLPQVQAWSVKGEHGPTSPYPPTDRQLFNSTNCSKFKFLPFDNATINPVLPSYKVNNLTMYNIEIPLNYSIEADRTTTIPWSNVTTLSFYEGKFRSGYRNQMMAFTMLILYAIQNDHGQVLLRSISQKDTYGTNRFIPFAKLWDVPHWNSHYPNLPRLVDYDPILHSQFNFDNTQWYRTDDKWFGTYGLFASEIPRRPYGFGKQHKLQVSYSTYVKAKTGRYMINKGNSSAPHRNPFEIIMLQGALRPHPDLQAIIDDIIHRAFGNAVNLSTTLVNSTSKSKIKSESSNPDYMTLHARVEPDMQAHPVCKSKKVLNLTDIIDFIETKWPDPPVGVVFMPINRQYLEKDGVVNQKDPQKTNWIAVENLNALNRARDYGLWNGRVRILEFGANALANTSYSDKPSTAGAMLNFFIGIGAKIFIGTEVSSFSHDLLATRFYRGRKANNYKYLPDGLHEWIVPGMLDPPGFVC